MAVSRLCYAYNGGCCFPGQWPCQSYLMAAPTLSSGESSRVHVRGAAGARARQRGILPPTVLQICYGMSGPYCAKDLLWNVRY
eukprot:7556-Rhodomonas_salina.1